MTSMTAYVPGSPPAASRDLVSGFDAVLGACQKELHAGSKMPAPGTTMSMRGKVARAVSQRRESCGQEATFVGWKWAVGRLLSDDGWGEYWETRADASGRRARSPIRTEQPRSRRSLAKARLIPC